MMDIAPISAEDLARTPRVRRRPPTPAPMRSPQQRLARALSLVIQAVTDQSATYGQDARRRGEANERVQQALADATRELEGLDE